jgi:hypothetical protein
MPLFASGWQSRIWFDGLAAHGYLEDIEADGNVHAIDVSTFVNDAKTFIPGLADCKIKMKGFFDADSVDPESTFEYWMMSRRRTVFPVTYFPDGGDTIGDMAVIVYGLLTSYTVDVVVKDAVAVKQEFQSSRGMLQGKVLVPNVTETASNAGTTSLDNAASSADGGSATLHVSAVSGTTPSLTVKLQHSDDDGVGDPWADVTGGAFAAKTEVGGEFIEFSGTLKRYVRVVTTVSGTSPSFTYNVAVHRN